MASLAYVRGDLNGSFNWPSSGVKRKVILAEETTHTGGKREKAHGVPTANSHENTKYIEAKTAEAQIAEAISTADARVAEAKSAAEAQVAKAISTADARVAEAVSAAKTKIAKTKSAAKVKIAQAVSAADTSVADARSAAETKIAEAVSAADARIAEADKARRDTTMLDRQQLIGAMNLSHMTLFIVDRKRKLTMLEGELKNEAQASPPSQDSDDWYLAQDLFNVFKKLHPDLFRGHPLIMLRGRLDGVLSGKIPDNKNTYHLDGRYFRILLQPIRGQPVNGKAEIEGAMGYVMDFSEFKGSL
ncbi:hypothetical protein N658DRAFT_482940 [Parathielavia hyrcaniae]|uniref:Uncharacterized protein n=1 Tax=Parathielavia hyrcaniae TaxID=113614 RepID=A0AAN6Q8D5_9PEZI|nr:hypothetical protein N658DRAFT_482940 [Parathielavia hyrcaniae]